MRVKSLLERLLLWEKLLILGIVALLLIATPTILYLQLSETSLAAAKLEKQGMLPAAASLKTIQLSQQHRGLSALVLGGIASAKENREAKQRDADQAYVKLDAIVKSINDKAIDEAWQKSRQDWEAIRTGVSNGTFSVPQSYTAHTELVIKLLVVNTLIADYYGLCLDPDADSYQLIQSMYYQLPYLTEETGKLRAKGAGLLAKKEATPDDRSALASIAGRVNDRLQQTNSAFNKAANANPMIKEKLNESLRAAFELTSNVMLIADTNIIKAETLSYSSVEYVKLTTQAIDAQFKVNEEASKEIDLILANRVDDLHFKLWMMIVMMSVLVLCAGLIAYLIARSVTVPLANAVNIAQRVAAGDLTANFDVDGRSESAQLMRALKEMNDSLFIIVSNIRDCIRNMCMAINDIASGNADLSSRTESQASSLEQTAASMEEVASTVKVGNDNAIEANSMVNNASDVAIKGGKVVAEVVHTMRDINDRSLKIVDIIGVIDGIAFQTNILALNAAVEAARAGEQGRGFAVVASEVRSLAQRSASAAKEIKSLIDASVEKVNIGNNLAGQAGKSMEEIVTSVKNTTSIMSAMVHSSREQSSGIEQINQAISHMDDMTQQNAALVEQAAAAAESLNQQADTLTELIAVFKLK
ncbi:methyl-accepting chemotaxis protein [Undibacterium flavidum]|uniref:Nitrate- and nitrite sensing domain-containing protein n=1 Tax=Undibacterium flavidum TaxID=2762297 RepID=A0ABR6Y921_9BURK|nr:methyl-accepting chemotaxis protein [Undibacterium flavidum]MBC3873117.1 nitrate- and nitrite sensing domain-containing protein [Undibacterium flavidum]